MTLLKASDSEEDISEKENHTSDDSIHPTSESDCDTSDSEDDRDNVQSRERKITWSAEPFPQHGRTSSANIIKLTPGPTRYAISRIDDIRSSFQVIMNNNLSDIVLKMTNIEGQRCMVTTGKIWMQLHSKHTLVFYCWLVFIDHMVNQQRACGTRKQVGPFFLLQCHSKLSVASLVCVTFRRQVQSTGEKSR